MPKLSQAGRGGPGGSAKEVAKKPKSAKLKSTRKFLRKGKLTVEMGARTAHKRVSQAMRSRDKARTRRRVDGDDDEDPRDRTDATERRVAQKAAREFAEFDSGDESAESAATSASDSESDDDDMGATAGRPSGREEAGPIEDAWDAGAADAADEDEGADLDVSTAPIPKGRGNSTVFDANTFAADVQVCTSSAAALRRVCLLFRVASSMLCADSSVSASTSSAVKEKAALVDSVKGSALLDGDLANAKSVVRAAVPALVRALWAQLGLSGNLPAAPHRGAVPLVDLEEEVWSALHVCTAVTCSSILRLLNSNLHATDLIALVDFVPHLVPLLRALASSPPQSEARGARTKLTDAEVHAAAERTVMRWGHALVRLMTHADVSVRSSAFVGVLDLAWGFGGVGGAVEILFKAVYLSVIRASRLPMRGEVQSMIRFLITCTAELWGLDMVAAYSCGFSFLRQLSAAVRQAMSKPSPETRRKLCSWQFVNGVRALQTVVCKYPRHDQLFPLFYPLVQIVQSVLDLFPLVSYAPLHLQLISILNGLASAGEIVEITQISLPEGSKFWRGNAKGVVAREDAAGADFGGDGRSRFGRTVATPLYVPITPYIFRILGSPPMRQPKADQAAPKDLKTLLKLRKETQLRSLAVQKYIVGEAVQLLLEFFALNSMSVGFPEVMCGAVGSLRALRGEWVGCSNVMTREVSVGGGGADAKHKQQGGEYVLPAAVRRHMQTLANSLRLLADSVDRNSSWIIQRRQGVRFGPRDVADVLSWEASALTAGPPLLQEYVAAQKRRTRGGAGGGESHKGNKGAPSAKRARHTAEADDESDDSSSVYE